jgi:hypothetical protein
MSTRCKLEAYQAECNERGQSPILYAQFRGIWDLDGTSLGQANCIYTSDSYYYLGGMDLSMMDDDVMIYASGAYFHPLPGHYQLPLSSGRYTVDNGKVTMTTNGGGTYEHPLSFPSILSNVWSFGWFTFFSTVTPAKNFTVTNIWTPPIIEHKWGSVQRSYIWHKYKEDPEMLAMKSRNISDIDLKNTISVED